MIAYISGFVHLSGPNWVSVIPSVNLTGVGYRVFVPKARKYSEGDQVVFHTHLYVRDGIMDLYGFMSVDELRVFEALISVNGIGPKVALRILEYMGLVGFLEALLDRDREAFTSVPGVGKTMAEKICKISPPSRT